MKLGTFIVAALCIASPALADHMTQIDHYQRAYGNDADPHLLVLIANEYRAAGKPHEALAYYCSYLFTAAAGDDADYASQQAHLLRPGAESDHDACTTSKAVSKQQVDIVDALPPPPPRISKREIAGLGMGVVGAVSFGIGLYETSRASHYNALLAEVDTRVPRTAATIALQSKANRAEAAEKWFLAGSALAVVAGGVLFLAGRHDRLEAAGQVTVAPTVNRHGAGLALSGGF